jgi:hypothetical protein
MIKFGSCATFLALSAVASGTSAASYRAARDLYDQGEVAKAASAYESVLTDANQTSKDRAAAARELARIDWLIDGNLTGALKHLKAAASFRVDDCKRRAYQARILREGGRFVDALAAAADLSSCDQRSERDELLAERAHSELALRRTAAAERSLAQISPVRALSPPVSAMKLEAALVGHRPAAAFKAWKDYFWLTSADAPPRFQKEPVRTKFVAGARSGAAPRAQCRLVDLLTRAGFDEASTAFQSANRLGGNRAAQPLCAKAGIYMDLRRKLLSYLIMQNRKMAAMSPGDKAGMQKIADGLGEFLTKLVQESAARLNRITPPEKGAGPVGVVTDAFNFGSTFGFTSGYPSVHLGHIVRDETQTVSQYGKSAQLNFRVLDQMISNGFQSWLWDGEQQTGGWGSTGSIVQIRPPYALSTISWTSTATDPAARKKADDDAREDSAKDPGLLADAQASGKKVVYLPGLADRLKLQSIEQMLAELKTVPAHDLPERFAALEDELTTAHSIWIHEGRHALDDKYLKDRKFSQADLEYRAKLAEILLARYPRMAFGSINDSLINSESSHGEANTRIMTAYADWIASHASEIRGFDPAAPALTQMDKLSDAQLRTVAAALADFDTPEGATASADSPSGTSRR